MSLSQRNEEAVGYEMSQRNVEAVGYEMSMQGLFHCLCYCVIFLDHKERMF